MTAVRVRFCPSPTGNPHVGLIRTCLFNWAYARHTGGTFVFRVEDTDAARDSEQSYQQLLDALRWLRLDWDEGPEVGGPYAPYRQSERRAIYADIVSRLHDAGLVYESYSSAEEIEARQRAAGRDPKLGYDNYDRELSDDARAALRAEGRQPVLRLRMPDEDLGWNDIVRGPVTFAAGSVPDFVDRPREWRSALPARQSGRRRTHAYHPRPARRGLAAVDPAADCAVSRPDRDWRHRHRAAVRTPSVRHGGGQQEALQTRSDLVAEPLPTGGISAGRIAELPRAARLVDRRGP